MPSQEEIEIQQSLLAAHRRTLGHLLQQAAQFGGTVFAPPQVANGIREARAAIQKNKHTLRGWGVAVADHPDDEPGEPLQPEAAHSQPSPGSVGRTKLRQILTDYFDDEELRALCFDLKVDYESLGGSGKASKARELIAFTERRGRFQELVSACQAQRPNAPWEAKP